MKLVHPSPRVAARIGRIVPRSVVHDGPSHELGSGIVRVPVVVKEVSDSESSNSYRIAGRRSLARKLIHIAGKRFLLCSEAEVVTEKETFSSDVNQLAGQR